MNVAWNTGCEVFVKYYPRSCSST